MTQTKLMKHFIIIRKKKLLCLHFIMKKAKINKN